MTSSYLKSMVKEYQNPRTMSTICKSSANMTENMDSKRMNGLSREAKDLRVSQSREHMSRLSSHYTVMKLIRVPKTIFLPVFILMIAQTLTILKTLTSNLLIGYINKHGWSLSLSHKFNQIFTVLLKSSNLLYFSQEFHSNQLSNTLFLHLRKNKSQMSQM